LAERVGRARAAKLALLGEPFSGIIAGDLGIATLVVPEANLDETSRNLVNKFANGPTKAYAAARTLLKAWSAGGIAAADVMMLDVAAHGTSSISMAIQTPVIWRCSFARVAAHWPWRRSSVVGKAYWQNLRCSRVNPPTDWIDLGSQRGGS